MQTTLNSIERQATFLMMPMCSNLTCFVFKLKNGAKTLQLMFNPDRYETLTNKISRRIGIGLD